MKRSSTQNAQNEQKAAVADKAIEDIAVSMPDLDFSGSPLPDLNVSSLNVAAPQIPTNNIFSAPSVNSDFSYSPNIDISVPVPQINIELPPSGGQPQIDCSAFSSVPACSYTGVPGSAGYEACKKCYPNK